MASAARLYTPEVLALATSLASYPLDPDLVLRGEARSPTCGSAIVLGLACDPDGSVTRVGLRALACAIGQASAAIFAKGAIGRDREAIAAALASLSDWLGADAPRPDWPGLETIDAARGYPARHGAILLPWKAALAALPPA